MSEKLRIIDIELDGGTQARHGSQQLTFVV
jgi:hypothetical protein